MSLRHELEIPPDDPFKFDKLKREEEAKTLTSLVKNYSDGFVLALNNEWGAGKTTFVKMWQVHMENEGIQSLYFNAWENDYQEDVLVALLSELDVLKDDQKTKFKDVVKKAVPFAGNIALGALKGLVATYGLDRVLEGAIDGTIKGSETLLKSEIDAYSKRKDGLKDFQKSLEDYAKAVSGEHPLVFIIDELDRCRPSYAVEVLEQIKHIFSVPGIVFVLAIDKVQLGHAVKGVYGSPGMNDVEYLRRFIDVEFSLPMPSTEDYVRYLYEYFNMENVLSTVGLVETSMKKYGGNFLGLTILLTKYFNSNLRQIERLFAHLKVLYTAIIPNNQVSPSIFVLLTILKQKEEGETGTGIYTKLLNADIEEQELIDELTKVIPTELTQSDHGSTVQLLSFLYNNELRFRKGIWPELVKKGENGEFSVPVLDYKQFKTEDLEAADTLHDLRYRSHIRRTRLSVIIGHIELSSKYFENE